MFIVSHEIHPSMSACPTLLPPPSAPHDHKVLITANASVVCVSIQVFCQSSSSHPTGGPVKAELGYSRDGVCGQCYRQSQRPKVMFRKYCNLSDRTPMTTAFVDHYSLALSLSRSLALSRSRSFALSLSRSVNQVSREPTS